VEHNSNPPPQSRHSVHPECSPRWHRRSRFNVDLPVLLLVLAQVLPERNPEQLGMLRGHDDAGMHPCARQSGQHAREVQHKLRQRMRDDDQVGVDALGFLLAELDVDLVLDGGLLATLWVLRYGAFSLTVCATGQLCGSTPRLWFYRLGGHRRRRESHSSAPPAQSAAPMPPARG